MRGALTLALALSGVGCGGTTKSPFDPVPACVGATISPLMGDRQMVMSTLAIADFGEGFDLDGDKKPDNKLALLGPLANPALETEFHSSFQAMIAIEMYGWNGEADSSCTKSAFYLGEFNKDRDQDGKTTTWDKGDCLDTDANVAPGKSETIGNRLDDDCDGYADNAIRKSKPADATDEDGDGFSLADGDCDDRAAAEHLAIAKSRHPGALDVCDDGIDQNCDGLADNDASCHPFQQNNVKLDISDASFTGKDPSQPPLIRFEDGVVADHVLSAGPDPFTLDLPFLREIKLALTLNATRIQMALSDDVFSKRTNVTEGMLGGVLDAVSLSAVTNIDGEGIIRPDQTLLDALFAGDLAPLIGLDTDDDGHYLPDMDVDRDGLEAFWEENGRTKVVDSCRDGDGTIIHNNFDGQGTSCVFAKDAKGAYRFRDGISLSLKFKAVPVRFGTIVETKITK